MLGRWNNQPSDPAYYIEDCRILSCSSNLNSNFNRKKMKIKTDFLNFENQRLVIFVDSWSSEHKFKHENKHALILYSGLHNSPPFADFST